MRSENPKYVEKRKKFMAMQKAKSQDKFNKGGLSPKQKKIAAKAPPPDKIDAKDFAVLKAEKAKGRGQGLQDEKMKPGKIMKARVGKSIRVKDDDSFSKKYELQEKGVIDKKTGTGRERVAKAVKATKVGKILLPIVGAGVAAHQFLKSKMKKDKKMGGGMMKKYSKGGGADMGIQKDEDKISERTRTYALAQSMKDKDRLTERDIDMANEILKGGRGKALRSTQEMISRLKKLDSAKKMGGGMMQKPMGYDKGGDSNMQKTIEKAKEFRKKSKQRKGFELKYPGPARPGNPVEVYEVRSGGSVSVKTKLGRNRPTKLY